MKQKDKKKFEELKSEVTIDALNEANMAYKKSFEQLEIMLDNPYLEDDFLRFCNKEPVKGLAFYLENHEEIVGLLKNPEKKENIMQICVNKDYPYNYCDSKEGHETDSVYNILTILGGHFENKSDMINKLFELLPNNLNLLKGLEEGIQFKTKISNTKDFIERRTVQIETKLNSKYEEIKKEKAIIFEELTSINENLKKKTDKKEIDKFRRQKTYKVR